MLNLCIVTLGFLALKGYRSNNSASTPELRNTRTASRTFGNKIKLMSNISFYFPFVYVLFPFVLLCMIVIYKILTRNILPQLRKWFGRRETKRQKLHLKLKKIIRTLILKRSRREYREHYLLTGHLGPKFGRRTRCMKRRINLMYSPDRDECQDSVTSQSNIDAIVAPDNQDIFQAPERELNEDSSKTLNMDSAINKFCDGIDFLKLHRTASILFDTSRVQQKYESIATKWKRLSPISSARLLFNTTENVLHPGCIFLSKLVRKDTPIVSDTGASTSLTPFRDDFVSFTPCDMEITGIGAMSPGRGRGIVRWKIYDQNNVTTTIETTALYMPEANIRLYSPQNHFIEKNGGRLVLDQRTVNIEFPKSSKTFSIPFHRGSNLPLIMLSNSKQDGVHYSCTTGITPNCHLSDMLGATGSHSFLADILPGDTDGDTLMNSVYDKRNINLSGPQHELLAWHYRLGHVSMWTLQQLLRPKKFKDKADGVLPKTMIVETKFNSTHRCVVPQYAACNLAKRERTPIDS